MLTELQDDFVWTHINQTLIIHGTVWFPQFLGDFQLLTSLLLDQLLVVA
jgi:hypothetical protein